MQTEIGWRRSTPTDLAAYLGVDEWGERTEDGWTDATKQAAQRATSVLLAQLERTDTKYWCAKCQSSHSPDSDCQAAAPYAMADAGAAVAKLEAERDSLIEEYPCKQAHIARTKRCGVCPACTQGPVTRRLPDGTTKTVSCYAQSSRIASCGTCAACKLHVEIRRAYAQRISAARQQWQIDTAYPEVTGRRPDRPTAPLGCQWCTDMRGWLAWSAAKSAVIGRRTPEGEWRPGVAHRYLMDGDGHLDIDAASELFGAVLARCIDWAGPGTAVDGLTKRKLANRKSFGDALSPEVNSVAAYLHGYARNLSLSLLAELSPTARDSDAVTGRQVRHRNGREVVTVDLAESELLATMPRSTEDEALDRIQKERQFADASETDMEVLHLFELGLSERQIAEVVGLSRQAIYRARQRLRNFF